MTILDPETLLIRRQEDEAARKRRLPLQHWPSSPRALAPRMRVQPPPLLSLGREKSPPLQLPGTLTASRLKITTMLNAAELLAIKPPHDQQRVTLRVQLPDRTITAEAAAKSLRKAQTAIREAGADAILLMLQGHLVAGDRVLPKPDCRRSRRRLSPRHDQKPPRSTIGPRLVCGGAVELPGD